MMLSISLVIIFSLVRVGERAFQCKANTVNRYVSDCHVCLLMCGVCERVCVCCCADPLV